MAVYHMRLAHALDVEQKFGDDAAERREAIRLKSDNPYNYSILARDLLKLGKLPEAEAEARTSIRMKPDEPKFHDVLGMALRAQNKLREAVAEFAEAARLNPSNVEFQINMKQTAARLKPTN
jgi:predicted Zn-dependent protease